MQHHKHPPAIKLVYPATAKRDAGHGVADATKMTLSALSICHNTDYDCDNLKPLTECTEISLMPRESWEHLVLDSNAIRNYGSLNRDLLLPRAASHC